MSFQKNNKIKKGSTISDAQKRLISESMKKYWTPERREEQRQKIGGKSWSPSTQFKSVPKEEHPHWKGGISFIKIEAKIRDNYTCQICGLRDEEIVEADHIVPVCVREDLKYEPTNIITLCPNCHKRKTLREIKSGIYKTNPKLS